MGDSKADPGPVPASPLPKTDPGSFSPARLAPFPERVDLGEQIVGSSHTFRVAQPIRLPGAEGGLLRASLAAPARGDTPFRQNLGLDPGKVPAFSTEAFELEQRLKMGYLFGRDQFPIEVQFTPSTPGIFHAALVLEVAWYDGTSEQHIIHLSGRARLVGQAPERSLPDPTRRGELGGEIGNSHSVGAAASPTPEATIDFWLAAGRAKAAVGNLSKWRELGVDTAEQNAMSFKEMPPEALWWEDLLELAMTMGAYGVFGAIAKKVGPRIAKAISKSATDKSFLTDVVTDGIKDGLKLVSKNTARAHRKSRRDSGDSEQPASTNARINFFAEQKAILQETKEGDEKVVDKKARLLLTALAVDPRGTLHTLDLLTDEVLAAQQTARSIQQSVSEQQWLSAVAMADRGTERVFDPKQGSHRPVTKVADDRGASQGSKGVLTIEVVVSAQSKTGDELAVLDASIRGVSQELADRLHAVPLVEASTPLMIVARWKGTTSWITRDEVGRIRVYGAMPREDGFVDGAEAQMHLAATRIANTVLAKSLRAWGVEQITSNDATMRGD